MGEVSPRRLRPSGLASRAGSRQEMPTGFVETDGWWFRRGQETCAERGRKAAGRKGPTGFVETDGRWFRRGQETAPSEAQGSGRKWPTGLVETCRSVVAARSGDLRRARETCAERGGLPVLWRPDGRWFRRGLETCAEREVRRPAPSARRPARNARRPARNAGVGHFPPVAQGPRRAKSLSFFRGFSIVRFELRSFAAFLNTQPARRGGGRGLGLDVGHV